MQRRSQTMWDKIALSLVPKIVEDSYEYIKANLFTEKPKRKSYDTYKFTKPEINYMVRAYRKLKISGKYGDITKMPDLYDHFNEKFQCDKGHRSYYVLIRKNKEL